MQMDFFAREVAQSGVLTPEETVGIFCHLSARGAADPAAPPAPGGEEDDAAEPLVAGYFRADARAPQLGFCAAPGVLDTMPAEECGLAGPPGAAALRAARPAGAAVLDGRGLCTG